MSRLVARGREVRTRLKRRRDDHVGEEEQEDAEAGGWVRRACSGALEEVAGMWVVWEWEREVVGEGSKTVELSGGKSCRCSRRGWVTKQCRTEEGARKGNKGRGPRPPRGPTVGVHVQR